MSHVLQHSGAMISFVGQRVIKSGASGKVGDRVESQGRWLIDRTSEGRSYLPRVSAVGRGWYMMELLEPVPTERYDDFNSSFITPILNSLHDLWAKSTEVTFSSAIDWRLHHDKVKMLTGFLPSSLGIRFKKLRDRIDFTHLIVADHVHGDSTFENVMYRAADEQLVLTDPIPAYDAMPSVRAVDFGKLLQSIYGWETLKYNSWLTPHDALDVIYDVIVESVLGDSEIAAAHYMCAVHLLRAIPYYPQFTTKLLEMIRRVVDNSF